MDVDYGHYEDQHRRLDLIEDMDKEEWISIHPTYYLVGGIDPNQNTSLESSSSTCRSLQERFHAFTLRHFPDIHGPSYDSTCQRSECKKSGLVINCWVMNKTLNKIESWGSCCVKRVLPKQLIRFNEMMKKYKECKDEEEKARLQRFKEFRIVPYARLFWASLPNTAVWHFWNKDINKVMNGHYLDGFQVFDSRYNHYTITTTMTMDLDKINVKDKRTLYHLAITKDKHGEIGCVIFKPQDRPIFFPDGIHIYQNIGKK